MKIGLALKRTFRDLWDELFLMVGMSMAWWLGVLLIIPAGGVTAGINFVGHRLAHDQRVNFGFFWDATKENFFSGWKVLGANLILIGLIVVNIIFYANQPNQWMQLITIIWLYALIFVLGASLYMFPLYFEQEDRRMLIMVRNALLICLSHPFFTLLLLIFIGVLAAISLLLPLILVMLLPALTAVAANQALIVALDRVPPEPV